MKPLLFPMKKQLALFLIFLTNPFLFGQVTFEKGYFVDNHDNKLECLIKNAGWKSNPTSFEYRLTEDGEIANGTIGSVKELVIYDHCKYVRANVQIDRSPTSLNDLTNENNPIWSQELLFLKVLVEGKASLYQYGETGFNRYFFSTTDSIHQLVYKQYLINTSDVATNYSFRNQLQNEISCQNDINDTKQLGYYKKELVKYFVRYNECEGDNSIVIHKTKKDGKAFNLRITPGINSSSLYIRNKYSDPPDTDFDNEINYRIGIESEFILPFNNNKWGIIVEPAYQYYESQKEGNYGNIIVRSGTTTVKNEYLDISLGVRHYFFLDKKYKNKIFVNAMACTLYNENFSSNIDFPGGLETLVMQNNLNFAIGAGLSISRFSAEMRYYTSQNVLAWSNWTSDFKKVSVVFGIRLF